MDDGGIERSMDSKRFRLGRTLYVSKEKVTFPVWMKTGEDDILEEEVTANVIESSEVAFLCGEETLSDFRTTLYFGRRKLRFEREEKEVPLIRERHLLVKLESVRGQEGKPAYKKTRGLAGHVKNSEPNTSTRSPLPGHMTSR